MNETYLKRFKRMSIYVLCEPAWHKNAGAIRYVGKTIMKPARRFKGHRSEAKNGKKRTRYVTNWVFSRNFDITMEVIEEHLDIHSLNEAEIFYISYFRSLGFNLTNHGTGGEGGMSGVRRVITQEHKDALSRAKKGKPIPQFLGKISPMAGNRNQGKRCVDENGTVYRSARAAARELSLCQAHTTACLKGKANTVKGHTFKYIEDEDLENPQKIKPIRKDPNCNAIYIDKEGNTYFGREDISRKTDICAWKVKKMIKNGERFKNIKPKSILSKNTKIEMI